jgi:multidrug resistance efflux pump
MTRISLAADRELSDPGAADLRVGASHPAGRANTAGVQWGRFAKLALAAALLGVGTLTVYQQLVVRISREAVVNARVVTIRAPMDGIIKSAVMNPGDLVGAGVPVGRVEDPTPDDARVFQLQQEAKAAERERNMLLQRLADLDHARAEASTQAESYRLGRVRQDELRVEEARASLAAATARGSEAIDSEKRGTALYAHGYMAAQAYERLSHAREVAQQETIAARKRLDALGVELDAARNGTYLGDNYNDVPSSFQRARELAVRIDETKATLDELKQKGKTIAGQLVGEQKRLTARSSTQLAAPISGNLWTVQAAAGEYVRKGQELFTVLDCSTVVVTASVSERDYNELWLGDPVRFRVAGTGREYSGTISKLGLTSTGRSFAISPEERHHQVAVQLADLEQNNNDRCAVGRTGEVIFEGRSRGVAARLVESVRHFLGLA